MYRSATASRTHAVSVLAHITRCGAGAVVGGLARIPALSVIAIASTVAVRADSAFLARSMDTGSVSAALRVAAAFRRFTSHNGHAVTHRAVVLIVSAGVAFPALSAVPHRLQIDRVVGSDQAVRRRLLLIHESFGHLTPRTAVIGSGVTFA